MFVCFQRFVFFMMCGAGFFLMQCSNPKSKSETLEPSVNLDIVPSVAIDTTDFTSNCIFKAVYHWKTGANFAVPSESLTAKVHFVTSKGDVLWQDDHQLELPITQWKPDTDYHYERIVYIPLLIKPQQIDMRVGLYAPEIKKRFFLNAIPVLKDYYSVASLSVKPPVKADDLPEARIEFIDGWYAIERDLKGKNSWRWMKQKAECNLKNPHRAAQLFIRGWFPTEKLGSPSTISLKLGSEELARYENLENEFEILMTITEDKFKQEEFQPLTLETNASYVPSDSGKSIDSRHLSAMIKLLYFN